MLGYLSCSKKRTIFRERSSRKTVSFEEQVMSKAKFSPQMETIVFIILQIFYATREVLKIGVYSRISPSFSWGIFGHVTCLDQSRASKKIWWITMQDMFKALSNVSSGGTKFEIFTWTCWILAFCFTMPGPVASHAVSYHGCHICLCPASPERAVTFLVESYKSVLERRSFLSCINFMYLFVLPVSSFWYWQCNCSRQCRTG